MQKKNKQKKKKECKNYKSIYNRLDSLLEQRSKRQTQKIEKDLTTGRELFKPNLNSSKDSYELFVQSLSKEKIKVRKNSIEK